MKKLFLSVAVCFGSIGLMAQHSFTNPNPGNGSSETIQNLLNRKADIGKTMGLVSDYFTTQEQKMLNQYLNPNQSFAPVTIAQNTSMTIDPTASIACAGTSFTDNSLYRVFDLPGEFGINNGLAVNSVQFGFDANTFGDFPVYVNVYEIDNPSQFPANYATMTLVGSATFNEDGSNAGLIVDVPVSASIAAGKTMVVELKLVDDGTETNMTRFACNFEGETAPAYIMAPECGANTPMSFASLGLANNLIMAVLGDDEPGGGGVVLTYGIDNASYNFLEFDQTDPSIYTDLGVSPIGPGGNFENAGAIDPNDHNTAYVLSNDNKFYKIDIPTGTYTQLGTIAPAGGGSTSWAGAEFNPVDGQLYAVTTDLTNSYLYTIDIAGLSSTQIGSVNSGAISLMIDGNGVGYSSDINDDSLYSIDLSDGTATYLATLPFDLNYGQGGTWISGDNDAIYLSAFNNTSFQAEWWRISTFDGTGTLIGPFLRGGALMQIGWSSATNPGSMGVSNQTISGFSYYPNPVKETISLKADKNIQSVVFYNIAGQKVKGVSVDSVSTDINMSNLKPGLYIMSVTIDGKVQNHKILKK